MISFRATDPKAVLLIVNKLVPERGITKDKIAEELSSAMMVSEDNTFLHITLDEEKLVGFMIAYALKFRDHVFLHQAWNDKKFALKNPQVVTDVFEELKAWAKEKDISEIRAETTRTTGAFHRKYKFDILSTIMSLDLKEKG